MSECVSGRYGMMIGQGCRGLMIGEQYNVEYSLSSTAWYSLAWQSTIFISLSRH